MIKQTKWDEKEKRNQASTIVQNKRVTRIETSRNHATIAWQWVNHALELWHFFSVFCCCCLLLLFPHWKKQTPIVLCIVENPCSETVRLRVRGTETYTKVKSNHNNHPMTQSDNLFLEMEWTKKIITKHKAKTIKLTKIRLTENEASRKTKSTKI